MNGFVSNLAAHIQLLLDVKHALGLPYEQSERHLHGFDALCARDYPGQSTLTREMAMTWAVGRPGEHVNGQMRRISPVRWRVAHEQSRSRRVCHPVGNPGQADPFPPAHFLARAITGDL